MTTKVMKRIGVFGVATVAGCALTIAASAQEFDMEANVQTAVDLVEDVPLNFGNLFAQKGTGEDTLTGNAVTGEDGSFIVFGPDGDVDATNVEGVLVSLGGFTPGEYTASGVGSFTNLSVSLPDEAGTEFDDAIRLRLDGANPAAVPPLLVGDFTTDLTGDAGTTDASGNLSFAVGARVQVFNDSDTPGDTRFSQDYQDGLYTGSFEMTVEFD